MEGDAVDRWGGVSVETRSIDRGMRVGPDSASIPIGVSSVRFAIDFTRSAGSSRLASGASEISPDNGGSGVGLGTAFRGFFGFGRAGASLSAEPSASIAGGSGFAPSSSSATESLTIARRRRFAASGDAATLSTCRSRGRLAVDDPLGLHPTAGSGVESLGCPDRAGDDGGPGSSVSTSSAGGSTSSRLTRGVSFVSGTSSVSSRLDTGLTREGRADRRFCAAEVASLARLISTPVSAVLASTRPVIGP